VRGMSISPPFSLDLFLLSLPIDCIFDAQDLGYLSNN
jgi:hypothetical protein